MSLRLDDWKDFGQLYSGLEKLFDFKGSLDAHKFIIDNNEINFSWSKRNLSVSLKNTNVPIRIYDVMMKKGTVFQLSVQYLSVGVKRSYMESLGELPAPCDKKMIPSVLIIVHQQLPAQYLLSCIVRLSAAVDEKPVTKEITFSMLNETHRVANLLQDRIN
ncbi:hypothetical protein Glove_109g145 [Diversispora epigaea]|uniref:Uncharacterized protein n=1 Tax=Diversispora epigaea TaxID=1348612 RepID=A0A397J2M7_9GLOM|nr:hypothetical protein Glove_109g145 [Diversispora epigaea]